MKELIIKIQRKIEYFKDKAEEEPILKKRCEDIINTYEDVLNLIEQEKIRKFGKDFNKIKPKKSIFEFLGVREL